MIYGHDCSAIYYPVLPQFDKKSYIGDRPVLPKDRAYSVRIRSCIITAIPSI